mgnify:CR=1 FL=1
MDAPDSGALDSGAPDVNAYRAIVLPFPLSMSEEVAGKLARYVRDHRDRLRWRAPTLVTAAEGLHPGQRALLEDTITDEVFQSYGSREFMLIGMECRCHAGYHVVTTCEGLAWAPRHLWDAMHTSARSDGKSIIVTGAGSVAVSAPPALP